MLKVGLTGGIGSGKTVVTGIFKMLGIPVFDADRAAKDIMESDVETISNIKKAFGEESYLQGKVNRAYLASLVFDNPDRLKQLNELVHPATIISADKWMEMQTTPYVIKEAALMFESGSATHLDYVIGVSAPQELRIKRAMQRDNLTYEEVKSRMNRQMDDTLKMRLCDFVILNDEKDMIIPQVLKLHEQFIKMNNESNIKIDDIKTKSIKD